MAQDGAVAPAFTTMTWPALPRFRNVVVSAPVLYGTRPAAPPAMFVAVVAVVAEPAEPAVVACPASVAYPALVAELALVADPADVA